MSAGLGPYKGYMGTASRVPGDREWHGYVVGISDVITFAGQRNQLEKEFQVSVDDYLDFCKNQIRRSTNPPLTAPTEAQ